MQPNSPSSNSLLKAMEHITYETFMDFSRHLFEQITLDVLVHGNWLESQAQSIAQTIGEHFSHRHDTRKPCRLSCYRLR